MFSDMWNLVGITTQFADSLCRAVGCFLMCLMFSRTRLTQWWIKFPRVPQQLNVAWSRVTWREKTSGTTLYCTSLARRKRKLTSILVRHCVCSMLYPWSIDRSFVRWSFFRWFVRFLVSSFLCFFLSSFLRLLCIYFVLYILHSMTASFM